MTSYLVLLIVGLHAPPASGVTQRILLKSGDADARGLRLDTVSRPAGNGSGRIVFVGTSSAILTGSGGPLTVIARTGDPLPAPLAGTFGVLSSPKINDSGAVVFRAGLNSPQGSNGLFLHRDGVISLIALGALSGAIDVNNQLQVAYMPSTARLVLWDGASGAITELVTRGQSEPGGGTILRFGRRLVLSDAGQVVFQAEIRRRVTEPRRRTLRLDAILAVSPTASLQVVVSDTSTDRRVLGRTNPFAVNALDQVAYATSRGVFRWDPAGGVTTRIAAPGDLVDGQPLTAISRRYVGINASGAVAFVGDLAPGVLATGGQRLILGSGGQLHALSDTVGSTYSPRLTDAGGIAWVRGVVVERYDGAVSTLAAPGAASSIAGFLPLDPSINRAGVVALQAKREALYELGRGEVGRDAPRPLVALGDAIGGTTVVAFGPYALAGSGLALLASEDDASRVLAAGSSDRSLAPLVRTGDPTPIGGTFDLDRDALDIVGGHVVFTSTVSGGPASSGVFRASLEGGRVTALVKAGDPAPRGRRLVDFGAVAAFAGGAAYVAGLEGDGQGSGMFITRARRTTRVAVSGGHTPLGGRFASFGAPVSFGRRLVFPATVAGGRAPEGLFQWTPGGVVRVVAQGARVRGGGRLGAPWLLGPNTVGRRGVVFGAPFILHGANSTGIFLRRRGLPRRLVLIGDATPLGTITDLGESIALDGDSVVFAVGLDGGSARSALVALDP